MHESSCGWKRQLRAWSLDACSTLCPQARALPVRAFACPRQAAENLVDAVHLRPGTRAERGWGMGHVTLWCGICSDQDHRDTVFYEPPHDLRHSGPLSGWMTRPDA
jgi:hypothetical protein